MSKRRLTRTRFDAPAEEPLGPMANLVDIMLVFACGLIAALVALSGDLQKTLQQGGQEVTRGRELPDVPRGVGEAGSGYESVGRVYRDPETGKLVLVGDEN